MNKGELIERLSGRLGDQKLSSKAVDALVSEIENAVSSGDKVNITGFGVFEKRERAARTGRNPRTGEPISVKKTVVPAFRPGSSFKELVSGGGGRQGGGGQGGRSQSARAQSKPQSSYSKQQSSYAKPQSSYAKSSAYDQSMQTQSHRGRRAQAQPARSHATRSQTARAQSSRTQASRSQGTQSARGQGRGTQSATANVRRSAPSGRASRSAMA